MCDLISLFSVILSLSYHVLFNRQTVIPVIPVISGNNGLSFYWRKFRNSAYFSLKIYIYESKKEEFNMLYVILSAIRSVLWELAQKLFRVYQTV